MGNSESSEESKKSSPATNTTPFTNQKQPVQSPNALEDYVDSEHSTQKDTDCYFYYYSTCSKGESCSFRHEPSALGCEKVCVFWKKGKCINKNCNFRHMELGKNRKVIPCYWESQPGGCLKAHCPFKHQNIRPEGNQPSTCTPSMDINFKAAQKEFEEKPPIVRVNVTLPKNPYDRRDRSSGNSPPSDYPPSEYPSRYYPARNYSPSDYQPRNYPPWQYSPRDYYPPRDSTPFRDYYRPPPSD